MLFLPLFLVTFPQVTGQPYPPLPPRAYQPNLVDPGLDGERLGAMRNGELTPDGKVLIAYRDTKAPTGSRVALTASAVHPDRLNTNAYGYLSSFYDYDGTTAQDFTFGAIDVTPSVGLPEQDIIHERWIPGAPPNDCKQDPDYPIEPNPHITIALKTLPGGNPYRSDADGDPQNGGPYSCYKIWVLRLHSPGLAPYVDCTGSATGEPLAYFEPPPPPYVDPLHRYVCQDVTVVLDEVAHRVVHATLDSLPFQELRDVNDQPISGFEPSITADGKLVLYHGDGTGAFNPGDGNVTYIYNANGPQATGWTTPRSITQLPTFTGTPAEQAAQAEQFKQRYRIFAQPIRMAPVSLQPGGHPYEDGYTYADGMAGPADTVRGLYLWVSKDGSFFVAACAGATEAESDPPTQGPRTRAGNYICGDITGGYFKHIDDAGINPTRRGGPWNWPPRQAGSLHDSWRTMQFSTGIKPGLWEPLPGEGAPLPTQIASSRIPVLPVFESSIDSYGEVRCEEMDGNYLLYLACNESLMLNDELAPYEVGMFGRSELPGECDVIFDTKSTPDTSGRATRARCTLNSGAAFPQEVLGTSLAVRTAVGAALGPGLGLGSAVKLHECVGFKGQAIVFNATGNVVALGAPTLGGLQRITFQAFVKVLDDPSATLTLLEWGGAQGVTTDPVVTLKLNTQGKFTATVSTTQGNVSAVSRLGAVPFDQSMADSRSGWRHVAFTFDGNASGISRLRLFLDGQLEKSAILGSTSAVRTPAGVKYYVAGPGRSTSPDAVDDADKLLILDEIAVSDVLRTGAELRRDAYVPALDDGFEAWPNPGPALPMELDASEAHWPAGVPYDPDVVTLGRDLFESGILSLSGSGTCSACHIPAEQFADEFQPVVAGTLNFPTLFNAAFGTHKFFDGRAASLEAQAWEPILGSEMGPQTVTQVLARINQPGSGFDTRFTDPATFGEPASQESVAESIAMYIRTLNSGGSAWDNELFAREHGGVYLYGFPVMNAAQRAGSGLFFGKARCVACHRGTSFTDDEFHNVLTVETSEANNFRGGFTGRLSENGRVKTPTLRNVQHTAPYFHDGSKATLHDVILHYNSPPFGAAALVGTADVDLRPLELTAQEMTDLEAFLTALSGTIP